jgi:hypothetical protein
MLVLWEASASCGHRARFETVGGYALGLIVEEHLRYVEPGRLYSIRYVQSVIVGLTYLQKTPNRIVREI